MLQAVLVTQLERQSRSVNGDRALDVARVMSGSLQAAVDFEDAQGVQAALETLRRAEGAGYGVVIDKAGRTLGQVIVDPAAPRQAALLPTLLTLQLEARLSRWLLLLDPLLERRGHPAARRRPHLCRLRLRVG